MLEDPAFLQEIAENPDELGPRLRYADFLDERRDSASTARAEFIRVQCALDGMKSSDPECANLVKRERELLDTHWHLWMRPICQALGEPLPVPPLKRTWGEWARRRFRGTRIKDGHRWELLWTDDPKPNNMVTVSLAARRHNSYFLGFAKFTRGFVSHATLHARTSKGPTYLDRLFERAPIASLVLHEFDRRAMQHLARKGWLRRLRKLDLYISNTEILMDVIDAADATFLKSVELYSDSYEAHQAGLLLTEATTLQPQEIGFHHLHLTGEDLAALSESRFMGRLKHLILEGSSFDETAFRLLLERTPLQHLELIGLAASEAERFMGDRLRARFPRLKLTARAHPRDV